MAQTKAALVSALFLTGAVGISFGDVFYLKTVATNPQNTFTDPAIWGVGSMSDGNADQRYPGEDDWISYGTAYQSYFNFKLGGGSFTVKGVTMTGAAETWGRRTFTLENGTLVFSSGFTNNLATVNCNAGGGFVLGDACASRLGNGGNSCRFNVNANGSCMLGGSAIVHWLEVVNAAGGTFTLNPNGSLKLMKDFTKASYISNSGTFAIPNGLTVAGPVSAYNGTLEFRQLAGTMSLGGDLVKDSSLTAVTPVTDSSQKNVPVRLVLSGGTLEVTANVSFSTLDSVSMPDASAATVSVAAERTLDLAKMTFGTAAALTKTGAGALRLAAVAPSALSVNEGTLLLKGTVFGSLTVASGVSISPDPTLGEGDVVFSVADSDELTAAVACLTPAPDGLDYKVADGIVSLKKAAASVKGFSCEGEANLSDPTHWNTGSLPTGENVYVQGSSTIGIFDSSTPAFNSITVADGATLKVVGTVESLPPIVLNADGRILFAEDSVVTLPADFAANANALQIPVFEVATGAVVNVGASRKFKNVHVKLYGEIDWDMNLWFGTAENGETTYNGFDADGGVLKCLTSGTEKRIRWAEPESGGRVSVPSGRMTMRRMMTRPTTGGYYYGESFGQNNPKNEEIEIVLDETIIDQYGTTMYIAGGVTIHGINGGGIRKPDEISFSGAYNEIRLQSRGRLILDSGSLLRFNYNYNGPMNVYFAPETDGFEQVVVRDGSWMGIQYPQGTGKALARFEDGWWDVMSLQKGDDGNGAREWTTNAFHGLKGIVVPEGKFVGVRSSDCWTKGVQWDAMAILDPDAPISGAGSLVISNATPGRTFTAIVVAANNTATGEAKVLKSADPSSLVFADGANWAGTVVANSDVALTNLTDSAAAASVTINTLNLMGSLPVRLWKENETATCDQLHLTTVVQGDHGIIQPVPMNGYRPTAGDFFTIGTIAEGTTLPAVASGWTLSAGEAENGVCPLRVERTPVGMFIILR